MANKPCIIGLTGSIGMGKTTAASQFTLLGAKSCNADSIVHQLLEKGEALTCIAIQFPQVMHEGKVDRQKLGALVFSDAVRRRQLERIMHPRVIARELSFIRRQRQFGAGLIVLDIPLLFETGAENVVSSALLLPRPYLYSGNAS